MVTPKIVVLGGYGTFGRLISEQLARSAAHLVIAGRDVVKGQAFAASLNAAFVPCDVRTIASLRDLVSSAMLVVNAAGPFQARDYSIPQTCIEQGCHYIDLGDGREYVAGVAQLHQRAKDHGVFVCVGASTTPAITSAVVAGLAPSFQRIRSIKVALTAGNKNQAGVSTIASILAYVGLPVLVWEDGRWRRKTGWGLGEFIDFPKPVGRRRVQLCDVPDLELFPRLFHADRVVFKAGVELTVFNYALGVLGQLRRVLPSWNLPALAGPLVELSKLFKSLGTYRGCFAVWVRGDAGQERALAVVAPQNGLHVPTAPAVLLARKVLAGSVSATGAYPCIGFLSLAEFAEYLEPFRIVLVYGENGVWS